jgi:RHS repeat-associated protein
MTSSGNRLRTTAAVPWSVRTIFRGGQLLTTYEAGTSALKYVLQDVQGSARVVMSNNGGSSAILARHDYLPFGEEIPSGVGLRTTTQKYGQTDTNRGKYALTQRDDANGLDHTWWRKYESQAGRWTSSDPLAGSIADPQSLNRYSYTQNDPVNFVDPSGLLMRPIYERFGVDTPGNGRMDCQYYVVGWTDDGITSTGGFGGPDPFNDRGWIGEQDTRDRLPAFDWRPGRTSQSYLSFGRHSPHIESDWPSAKAF